jgi:hypothetical protein
MKCQVLNLRLRDTLCLEPDMQGLYAEETS